MRRQSVAIDRALTCTEVARVVSAYLDGELDSAAAARVGRHLAECPDCPPEAAAVAELRRALRQLGIPPAASVTRIRETLSSLG